MSFLSFSIWELHMIKGTPIAHRQQQWLPPSFSVKCSWLNISHFVGSSVGWLVCLLVSPLLFWHFHEVFALLSLPNHTWLMLSCMRISLLAFVFSAFLSTFCNLHYCQCPITHKWIINYVFRSIQQNKPKISSIFHLETVGDQRCTYSSQATPMITTTIFNFERDFL